MPENPTHSQISAPTSATGLAVLTGNGVSIGFSEDLRLSRITSEVLLRFEESTPNGRQVREALLEIADLANGKTGSAEDDFEKLVGAFDGDFLKIDKLQVLAGILTNRSPGFSNALIELKRLASEVNRLAVSHILEVIFEKSRAQIDPTNPYIDFVQDVVRKFSGPIHFGNLNYDTLLMSALLTVASGEVTDLADGRTNVPVSAGDYHFFAKQLRQSVHDFPSTEQSRIRLLQLHGSLTFWTDSDEQLFIKVSAEDLRRIDQWSLIRSNQNQARPVVVLTNQQMKFEKVKKYPFSLSYSMFERGLVSSQKWLIAGYSFRDDVTNQMLHNVYRAASKKPEVLVVTKGEDPSAELISETLGSIGARGAGNATVFRDGIQELIASDTWKEFARPESEIL